MTVHADVGAMTGREAPPRSNGELVFEEPWHARAFGLAVGLVSEHGLDWEDFRGRLIDEIGRWEREHASGGEYSYYERWAAALERLVVETGLISSAELEHEIGHITASDTHHHRHDH